ncbi:MAG: ORF6N domain-containing protein [Deltaproteobacteria bacterium]|nr:ORF6N domain-containing protein [Deltaproteobacteria bacterium]
MTDIVPIERIEKRILLLHGKKVMLDADLAQLYGVSTKRLNEQVKRNMERFPAEFLFQLTEKEKEELVAKWGWVNQFC